MASQRSLCLCPACALRLASHRNKAYALPLQNWRNDPEHRCGNLDGTLALTARLVLQNNASPPDVTIRPFDIPIASGLGGAAVSTALISCVCSRECFAR
jgi:hypothetical protein